MDTQQPFEWVQKGFLITHRDGSEAVKMCDQTTAGLYAQQNHAIRMVPFYIKRPMAPKENNHG